MEDCPWPRSFSLGLDYCPEPLTFTSLELEGSLAPRAISLFYRNGVNLGMGRGGLHCHDEASTHLSRKPDQSYLARWAMEFSSVQSLSCVQLFVTPWTAAHQASLSFTNPWSLLKLMSIKLVIPSNHLILCRPLLLLPSIFPSIRIFSNESALLIRWPIGTWKDAQHQ